MSDQMAPAGTPPARRGRAKTAIAFVVVALVGVAAGGFVSRAFGQGPWHPGFMMMRGDIDPDRLDHNIERMTRHFAIEVDANLEQEAKLAVIAKAAAKELLPLRQQAQRGRQEGLDLLAAPTIDRDALERLRTRQLELAET